MSSKVFDIENFNILSDEENYYFSVVDVISVLTEAKTPRNYWSDLKRKLKIEGSELHEKIVQLKMLSKKGQQIL